MARSSEICTYRSVVALATFALLALAAANSWAQPMGGDPMNNGPMNGGPGNGGPQMGPPGGGQPGWGGYQRKGNGGGPGWRGYGNWNGGYGYYPQQFSGSYFTRPYPYHLDYYKMRYGGSYAPYYGNLYGPSYSYYPAQYNGDYGPGNSGPNYDNGGQNYPPSGNTPDGPASAGGHWAWCWIPGTCEGATPVESTSPVDPTPSSSNTNSTPTLTPPQ